MDDVSALLFAIGGHPIEAAETLIEVGRFATMVFVLIGTTFVDPMLLRLVSPGPPDPPDHQ